MTTIVCLGDSITQGGSDPKGLGWVGRLNACLRQKSNQDRVYNLGISGDTVTGAHHRYFSEALPRRPDLLLLAIGTNDCQRAGTGEPVNLRSSLSSVMYQWQLWSKYLCAGLHKTVVIGVLPSDESRMPYINQDRPNTWILNSDLQNYNEALHKFCAGKDMPFINLWDRWQPEMCKTHMTDGVHPNDKGYDFMFDEIRGFLEEQVWHK